MSTPPPIDLLNLPHVRPRFEAHSSLLPRILEERIRQHLAKEETPCQGKVYQGYVSLFLPREEQHFWSPQLSLTLEETDYGSHLRGLYGPRPNVWTMFVFFYALVGFAALVIAIIGLSRYNLGMSAGILWWVPILGLIFGSIYYASRTGQKLGHDQLDTLHNFLAEATGLQIEEEYV